MLKVGLTSKGISLVIAGAILSISGFTFALNEVVAAKHQHYVDVSSQVKAAANKKIVNLSTTPNVTTNSPAIGPTTSLSDKLVPKIDPSISSSTDSPTTIHICQMLMDQTYKYCYDRDMTIFRIASVILWPSQLACTANSATVSFNPLNVSRDIKTGAAGTTQIEIDYSDGTSDTRSFHFNNDSNTDLLPNHLANDEVIYTPNISHTFTYSEGSIPDNLSYEVRILNNGDENSDQLWEPISRNLDLNGAHPCYDASSIYPNT